MIPCGEVREAFTEEVSTELAFEGKGGQGGKGIPGRGNWLYKGKEMWKIMTCSREWKVAPFGQTRGRITVNLTKLKP